MTAQAVDFKKLVRDVPDFPKKGIVFKDITPLLADAKAFDALIEEIAAQYKSRGITHLAGIESRGFLLAAAVAPRLGAGIILIRKKGKLPSKTFSAEYALEYGSDKIEIHQDAAKSGDVVLVIDDVIATGGTAKAACELVEKTGAQLAGVCFLIELSFLKGRDKLPGRDIFSVITY